MTHAFPFHTTVCGIDELTGHCEAGVTHVLSILDPGFPVPPAFAAFPTHARLELRFLDVIEAEPEHPRPEHVRDLLALGQNLLSAPRAHLLVHCHAGISRSTASMLLILAQAQPTVPADALADALLGIREKAWPNLRMVELGDAMLNRNGALVAAASRLYRHQLGLRPHLAVVMTQNGRGREVLAASLS